MSRLSTIEALKQKFTISIPVPIKTFTCGRVTKNGIKTGKKI